MRTGAIFLLVLLHAAAAPAAFEFSRYEPILQRQPFGATPVEGVDPAALANAAPARSFVQELQVRMCAITDHPDFGIRVGFVAAATPGAREQKSYYMRIGETQDGFTLVDADIEEQAALLRRGAEETWISMREGAVAMAASPGGPPGAGAAAAPVAGRPSYAERLRQRREMRKQHQEAKQSPQLTGEDLEKHLKEYQMELIRAGGALGPPLPIPLTEEMDDQLVSEGVLPPTIEAAEAVETMEE
jgi:hypothetical protein